jgi:hypothetical protein
VETRKLPCRRLPISSQLGTDCRALPVRLYKSRLTGYRTRTKVGRVELSKVIESHSAPPRFSARCIVLARSLAALASIDLVSTSNEGCCIWRARRPVRVLAPLDHASCPRRTPHRATRWPPLLASHQVPSCHLANPANPTSGSSRAPHPELLVRGAYKAA